MKKQYFVEQLECVVYVDPAFVKAAGQIDTDECVLFEKLREKYPAFKFVKKDLNKSNKTTYGKLTYARMAKFIETNIHDTERKEQALKELAKRKLEADGRSGSYAYVKSWFLSEFKEEYNNSSFVKADKNTSGAENNSTGPNNSKSAAEQSTT